MQRVAGIMQLVLGGLGVYPILGPKPDGSWEEPEILSTCYELGLSMPVAQFRMLD